MSNSNNNSNNSGNDSKSNVHKWSSQHVCNWVNETFEGKTKQALLEICTEYKLNGKQLLELDDQDLIDNGVENRLQRKQILTMIEELKFDTQAIF